MATDSALEDQIGRPVATDLVGDMRAIVSLGELRFGELDHDYQFAVLHPEASAELSGVPRTPMPYVLRN